MSMSLEGNPTEYNNLVRLIDNGANITIDEPRVPNYAELNHFPIIQSKSNLSFAGEKHRIYQ